MSNLSPELETLVLAERKASRVTRSDYVRVQASLLSRLGTSGAHGNDWASTGTPRSTSRFLAGKFIAFSAISIVLTLGGDAFYWASSRSTEASIPTKFITVNRSSTDRMPKPSTSTHEAFSPPPRVVSQDLPPPATMSTNPSAVTPRTRSTARPSDSLSDEVAILSRAEAELHRGNAVSALRTLKEHERKYPNGILTEERTAARIQALCMLGRHDEANAFASRLKPGSLHGEGVLQACRPNSPSKKRPPPPSSPTSTILP